MNFRNRALARVGAATLLASGVFAATGAPALAAGTQTDLELTVVGTRLAAGADGKIGWAKITNKGTGTPSKLSITADLSQVDLERIIALPFSTGDCDFQDDFKVTCEVSPDTIPGPGETLELPVFVYKTEVKSPYSAPVKFTINSPDDTNKGNNSKTVKITAGEASGVDLGVLVPDVKFRIDGENGPVFPGEGDELPELRAGDRTVVSGWVFNWGDVAATGLKVKVQLPKQVTFAEAEETCEYSADKRTATCTYTDLLLLPMDPDSEGDLGAAFYWPIQVAEDAEEPVTLGGGSWTVEALGQVAPEKQVRKAAKPLPKNVKMISAESVKANEVDASDNVDDFAVVLAGNGGGGGGLPVTGVQAGLIGGVGVAVVAAGGVMFLMARRRRVVLVTPGDEKSTV